MLITIREPKISDHSFTGTIDNNYDKYIAGFTDVLLSPE
jgi:hypothetical protein